MDDPRFLKNLRKDSVAKPQGLAVRGLTDIENQALAMESGGGFSPSFRGRQDRRMSGAALVDTSLHHQGRLQGFKPLQQEAPK